MTQRVAILGSNSIHPFLGHMFGQTSNDTGLLSFAARFSLNQAPQSCFQNVRRVEAEFRTKMAEIISEPGDINDRIRALWRFWMAPDAAAFHNDLGAEFSVIFYVESDQQEAISATGMSGIWGMLDGTWFPVVQGRHPMLLQRGIPKSFPGVFQLTRTSPIFVACAAPETLKDVTDKNIRRLLGSSYGG